MLADISYPKIYIHLLFLSIKMKMFCSKLLKNYNGKQNDIWQLMITKSNTNLQKQKREENIEECLMFFYLLSRFQHVQPKRHKKMDI